MGRIQVKRKAERITVTQKLKKKEPLNDKEINVVNHREIPSLIPVEITRGFRGTRLRFCLNSAVPLPSYIQSDISFSEFLRLVQQVIHVMQDCEAHAIREGNLDLNCSHVFYDYVSRTVRLIYWPLLSNDTPAAVEPFFQWMGEAYSHNREAPGFIGEYLEYFDRREEFDLFHFEKAVRSLQHDWDEDRRSRRDEINRQQKRNRPSAPKQGGSAVPTLLQLSSNTKIELKKFPFILGRSPEECDYAIAGNTYVGRQHLKLDRRGGRIYAVDLNSLNGSRLDGEYLPSGREVELRSGCKLTLGNEEFMFFAQKEQ